MSRGQYAQGSPKGAARRMRAATKRKKLAEEERQRKVDAHALLQRLGVRPPNTTVEDYPEDSP